MYCGIEVVSKPVHQWGIEELREFIDKNGEFLSELVGNEPDASDFVKVAEVGRDFERIAGMLATICEDTEQSDRIKDLELEVESLEEECSNHETTIEDLESDICDLEDEISELKEQLESNEE